MRIILHKPSHSRQAGQRATRLVPVDDTKLRHTNWQLLITSITRVEDEAVARTVHRLERPFLFLNVEDKHIFFVVLPVPRGFPQFGIIHVGGDD